MCAVLYCFLHEKLPLLNTRKGPKCKISMFVVDTKIQKKYIEKISENENGLNRIALSLFWLSNKISLYVYRSLPIDYLCISFWPGWKLIEMSTQKVLHALWDIREEDCMYWTEICFILFILFYNCAYWLYSVGHSVWCTSWFPHSSDDTRKFGLQTSLTLYS